MQNPSKKDLVILGLVILVNKFLDKIRNKKWWLNHSRDCGTKYRGCSPDCPKRRHEEKLEIDD